MNANAKFIRIAVFCTALLLVTWISRSSYPSSGYEFLPRSGSGARSRNGVSQQKFGDSDELLKSDSAPAVKHGQGYGPSLWQCAVFGCNDDPNIETTDEPEGEVLGLNGRPQLPPQAIRQQFIPEPTDDGSDMAEWQIQAMVDSILGKDNQIYWRMGCDGENEMEDNKRYEVLREWAKKQPPGIKFFFALDLFEIVRILPRLLGSIVKVMQYLGPENCGLSIVEGRSHDGTYKVLYKLNEALTEHGVRYWLQQSDINPLQKGRDRIAELSKLRNLAMDPLRNEKEAFSAKPLTLFVNDIALCPNDLLEMIYQHLVQKATQTCAMDWVDGGSLFYDVWVSRTMSGNTFFEIPQDMSWAFSRFMFWDEPIARDKYDRRVPFQVFSCWGGMVVLDSTAFMSGDLKFRRNVEGECYGGEPQTLASDLMKLNMNRVQTLPYVNVAYSDHESALAQHFRGAVHKTVDVKALVRDFDDDKDTERIVWHKPPSAVRCMPRFIDNWWVNSVYVPGDENLQEF